MEEPKIEMLHFEDNRLDVKMTHPIFHDFMEAAAALFREKGGVNFLSMRGQAGGDVFDIVIQKAGGKTPAERIAELEAGYHDPVAQIVGIACRYETSMTDRDRDIYNKAVMGIRAVLQPHSSV